MAEAISGLKEMVSNGKTPLLIESIYGFFLGVVIDSDGIGKWFL